MRTLESIRKEAEDEINSDPSLSDADKNAAKIAVQRGLEQERNRRVALVAAEEKQGQNSSLLRAAAAPVVAGAASFANSATFGYLPKIVGAVAGEDSQARTETALGAMQQTNPVASAVGNIGGLVSKFTPAGAVATGLSRGAGLAVRAGGAAVPGVAAIVNAAATRPFLQRASVSALGALTNLAGSAGAIGGQNLIESRDGDAAKLTQRMADAYHQTTSLSNLALSAGVGVWAGKYLKPVQTELKPIFERFKQITGREMPFDVVSNDAAEQQLVDAAARIPGLQNTAREVRETFVNGTRQMIQEIGERAGARSGETARAAVEIKRLRGVERGVGKPGVVSALEDARTSAEKAALAVEGGNTLNPTQRADLLTQVGAALKGKSRLDPRGGDMTSLIGELGRAVKRGPISTTDLEALRARLGKIAYVAADTDRGRKEARDLYAIVNKSIDSIAPQYGKSLKAAEVLRRAEDAMAEVKISNVDMKTLGTFWSGDKPLERWAVVNRNGATPEDIGAIKGFLFDTLLKRTINADGLISMVKLQKALNGASMHSREVLDTVLPGVADDLLSMATIAERGRKGIAKAEGSATAGRVAQYASTGVGAAAQGTLLASFLGNPFMTLAPALGAYGLKWVINTRFKSMLAGREADVRSLLAQGVAPNPIGPAANALQQQGGLPGVGQLGIDSLRSAAEVGQQAFRTAIPNQETQR